MSRYLTPSKIGLLALTALYAESIVPSAATIPVLSFLVSCLSPPDAENQAEQDRLLSDIHVIQHATDQFVSGIPGRSIWDLLLSKLWKLDSLDAFHAFFDDLDNILKRPAGEVPSQDDSDASPNRLQFSRFSLLGSFVRKGSVEFTRLRFHDAIVIWKAFIAYRAPTLAQWKKRNPTAGPMAFDINLHSEDMELESPTTRLVYADDDETMVRNLQVSTGDFEKLLEYQVQRIQHIGGTLPQEMKTRLKAMLDTGINVPTLFHYVEFLDAWKAGDYPSSFKYLHRYFDYTMHNNERVLNQYALLNLAMLHADFDCSSEALTAMEEAIAAARENDDLACLNYSLGWLYQFGKRHPAVMRDIQRKGILGPERDAILFMKIKAKENGLWTLLVTSLLSGVKLSLTAGGSVSQALEDVLKASHINVTKNVQISAGSQMMMHSSIMGRLGVPFQAYLINQIFLQCYAQKTPAEDSLQCLAHNAAMLFEKGEAEEAYRCVESDDQDKNRLSRHQKLLKTQQGLMKLRQHLYKNHLTAADYVLAQLKTGAGPSQEEGFEIAILEVDLQMRRRDFQSALEVLEALAEQYNEEETDIFCRIKIMTVKARLYEKAGVPQKGFSAAVRAINLSLRSKLRLSLYEAVNVLSAICNSMDEFAAARDLLESIAPQVLECENCELAAHTFSLLADAHVGLAGNAEEETNERKEELTKGLEILERAFDAYSQIEDVKGQCEMMAKKATIMHLTGDLVLANDYAAKYLAIREAATEVY